MASKRSKIILYVFGGLAIFLALIVYWGTRAIPLPNNAKQEGGMIHIDISEGATDVRLKKELSFVVPEAFNCKVGESGFTFNLKFTDGSSYTGNEMPMPDDKVLVIVSRVKVPGRTMSEFKLRRIQPKNGALKNVPYLVESKNGLAIYQYDYGSDKPTIGTM